MATTAKPTNERIAEMLAQVLSDLSEVKKSQDQITAALRKLTQQNK